MAGVPGRAERWGDGYPGEVDVAGARRFLDVCAVDGDPGPFGSYEIRRRDIGESIGGLNFQGTPDRDGSVTIGYGLIPSARGKGYATEALRALLDLARTRGATRVQGDTARTNTASQHVMTAAGMRLFAEAGHLRHYETTWPTPP